MMKDDSKAEMWCYRRIRTADKLDREQDQNSILDQLQTRRELLAQIIKIWLSLDMHAETINCNLVNTCILGMMPGKRRRGRPRMQYIDNIKKWTTDHLEENVRLTEDRTAWPKRSCAAGATNVRTDDTESTKVSKHFQFLINSLYLIIILSVFILFSLLKNTQFTYFANFILHILYINKTWEYIFEEFFPPTDSFFYPKSPTTYKWPNNGLNK